MSQRLNRIEEPRSEAKLRTKVNVGFVLAIILTCLISFLSWRVAQQASEDAELSTLSSCYSTMEMTQLIMFARRYRA